MFKIIEGDFKNNKYSNEEYLDNWPMLYILENGKKAYIGESNHVKTRMTQHTTNEEKRIFNKVHFIYSRLFNQSVTFDYESKLIQYIVADELFQVTNKNSGIADKQYYEKGKYDKKFELLWRQLQKEKLVKHSLEEIENSDLFKYSPYKELNDSQRKAVEDILAQIESGNVNRVVVNGMPGSGSPISTEWIRALIYDHKNSLKYAPPVWKKFIKEGRNGIEALKAPRIFKIPTKYEQLGASNAEGRICLDVIRNHYSKFPQGFEECAANIISKMDSNFIDFSLTRPWRDGGRDAIGRYSINTGGKVNHPLVIDCALEAKCYGINKGVGVREMSRLISRIRYRQFGIMITTGYVDNQAYSEVVDDGHPILIVTASDIAAILRNNTINSSNIEEWLQSIDSDSTKERLKAYYNRLND